MDSSRGISHGGNRRVGLDAQFLPLDPTAFLALTPQEEADRRPIAIPNQLQELALGQVQRSLFDCLQILDEFGVASDVATKRFAGAAEQLRRLGSDTA